MSLTDVYSKGVITQNCCISINDVGGNIKEILENKLKKQLEGKCCKDGYVKEGSIQVISYSSGKILNGSNVSFEVVVELLLAMPVEGMLIDSTADAITKAGIKASIPDTDPSPMVIFISRDHFHDNEYFNSIKENDKIIVRVIGQRFELNDPFIGVIGELVKPRNEKSQGQQPFVVLEE